MLVKEGIKSTDPLLETRQAALKTSGEVRALTVANEVRALTAIHLNKLNSRATLANKKLANVEEQCIEEQCIGNSECCPSIGHMY
jgi:hypothetical protein